MEEEVTIEITGESFPSGWDGGTGSMAPDTDVCGCSPVLTEIGTLRHDQASPALRAGRLSHDEPRDAWAAGPGVTPVGARTLVLVTSASHRSSVSSLGSLLGSHASGLSSCKLHLGQVQLSL